MFMVLLALWLIFAGGFSLTNCILGAVASGLVTLLCRKFMGGRPVPLRKVLDKAGKTALYLLMLLKEIVLANLAVLKLLYSRKRVRPLLLRFRSPLRSDGANTLVANSITLTPGTITVDVGNGEFCVHALDRSLAEGIESCSFLEKAKELEE